MSLILSLILALVLGALVAFLAAFAVMKWRVLDHPNDRSSHTVSTPKAGGLGIMLGVMVALAVTAQSTGFAAQSTQVFALVLFGVLTGLLGFYDDIYDLSARLKLLLLALLALGITLSVYRVTGFSLDQAQMTLPYSVALLGTALWVFVLGNATNFMDGSDGLIVTGTVVAAATLAMLSLDAGQGVAAVLALALMAAVLGFLPLNIPPASIFLGDTGALFIGFWLGGVTLFYVHGGPPGAVYAVVLVFMPWISDVLLTLAWRAMRQQDLLAAHHDHVYQLMLRHGMSHAKVALILSVQMIVCGLLAWVFRASATSELLALAAVASLAVIGHWRARTHFGANPVYGDNGPGPEH